MSSTLIVVGLMALGNIMPKQRQIMQEVTGLSPIILGIIPVMVLLGAFLCQSGDELASQPQFPVDGATLDVPEGLQLFTIAAVLGVFAAAIRGAEDDQGKKEKNKVELVQVDRIAMRLACAAGFLGICHMSCMNSTIWSWSDFTQTFKAASHWFPASPKDGFANSEALIEVPEGIQLLTISALLCVFKMVVDNSDDNDQQRPPQVQLVSASRIALRFAVATALLGFTQFASSFSYMLPASPAEGFGKSNCAMEMSEGVQLLIISGLLLVFMKAISEHDDLQKDSAEKKQKNLVQLVRVDAIAFRLCLAAFILGLFKIMSENDAVSHASSMWMNFSQMLPTSPAAEFGKSKTTVEVSEGMQLLVVSILLLVFKMVISEANDAQAESNVEPQVQLVRADAIAFRFAFAAGTFGLAKTVRESGVAGVASSMWANYSKMLRTGPAEGFGKSETTLDVSEGMQWLIVAILIFTFKIAISEATDAQQESEKKHIELVNAQAIATRFSFSAMLIASVQLALGSNRSVSVSPWNGLSQAKEMMVTTLMNLRQIFDVGPDFAKSDAVLEVPEGFQILVLSALILVFKLAIDSDKEPEESSGVREPKVQLVSAGQIALRVAIAGSVIGLGKLATPAISHSINAVMSSGELLVKGGMLGASTALVLWNAHKQSQNMKA